MNSGLWLAVLAALMPVNAAVYSALLARPALEVEELRSGEEGEEERAFLITTAGGHAVLVNAGPDARILRALGEALPPWQRTLDVLVLPDMGAEHAGGAPFVVERYRPSALLRPSSAGPPARETALAAALAAADGTRTERAPLGAGLVIRYGSSSITLLDL